MKFAVIFKILILKNGYTQQTIATLLNTTQQTVSRWLNGQNEPDLTNLYKLADIFNCSVDYLLGRNNNSNIIQFERKTFEEQWMKRIKRLRVQNNLTQRDLANKLNTTNSTICDWEKGRCEPSIYDLIKLADIFNCSVDYLLGREDDFGIIKSDVNEYTSDEKRIITIYRSLTDREKTLFDNLVNSFEDSSQTNKKKQSS